VKTKAKAFYLLLYSIAHRTLLLSPLVNIVILLCIPFCYEDHFGPVNIQTSLLIRPPKKPTNCIWVHLDH